MARKQIDWEAIEREFRAGIRSLRDIGGEFGITETAIRKRAKRDEWERDLSAKIAAKAESLVRKAEVRNQVRNEETADEKSTVAASAQFIADTVLNERKDVARSRGIVQKLFEELEMQIDGVEDLQGLVEALEREDNEKLAQIAQKVISFPSRVDAAKKLAEAQRIQIELERKVCRIKDDSSAEDFAKKIGEGMGMSAMESYRALCQAGPQ